MPIRFILWIINVSLVFYPYRNCTLNGTKLTAETFEGIDIQLCDEAGLTRSAGLISLDFAVCGIITCVSSYSHVALFTIVSDRVARQVRRLAFSNILRQHIGYFDVHFGGELNTRLTQYVWPTWNIVDWWKKHSSIAMTLKMRRCEGLFCLYAWSVEQNICVRTSYTKSTICI